ncbi:MAG: phytanoyl-CoA dioxygenase family protein, partial [Terrimicrobiaceae bacterium]
MITAQESTEKLSDVTPFSSWDEGTPPAGWFSSPLDGAAAAFYRENGFLVLDRVLTAEETDAITAEAARICRNTDGRINGVEPAPAHLSDDEVMQKTLCIHFPHKLSPIMHGTLSQPRIVQALTTTIGPNVKAMQSMLFFKAAGKPGQAWHQDEDYIP